MTHPITANVNPTYHFLSSQIDLVGSRDPNAVLAATGDALQTIIDGHDAESMRRRVKEDSWTPVEIVAHLADMEWIFGFRARTILCDDRPQLSEIDQDDWVRVQQPNQRDPRDLLRAFRGLRSVNMDMWRDLTEDDLKRSGHHVGAGITITLSTLRLIQAGHDLRHLAQIERQLSN